MLSDHFLILHVTVPKEDEKDPIYNHHQVHQKLFDFYLKNAYTSRLVEGWYEKNMTTYSNQMLSKFVVWRRIYLL